MTAGTTEWADYAALAETQAAQPVEPARQAGDIALVDLLDRLLGTGVVLAGDIVISLSGIDLVQVRLHALITTVRAEMVGPA